MYSLEGEKSFHDFLGSFGSIDGSYRKVRIFTNVDGLTDESEISSA